MVAIGRRIKEARLKKDITQEELAKMVGVTKGAIANYENNTSHPKEPVLYALINALDVDANFLFQDFVKIKTAPLYTSEALKLADDFDHHMDTWGQKAVRGVADTEIARYKEERAMQEAVESSEPPKKAAKMPKAKKRRNMVEIKVYDEPAAAGLGNYLDDPDYRMEQYPEHILPSGTDFGVRIDGDSMEPKIHNGYTVFVKAMPMIEPGQIGIFVFNGKSYCKKLVVDHSKRQTRLMSLNPKYEDIVIQEFDSFKTLGHVLGQWGFGSREDDFLDW